MRIRGTLGPKYYSAYALERRRGAAQRPFPRAPPDGAASASARAKKAQEEELQRVCTKYSDIVFTGSEAAHSVRYQKPTA